MTTEDDLLDAMSWEPQTVDELRAKAWPDKKPAIAAVFNALAQLEEEGWIERSNPDGVPGGKWRRKRAGSRRTAKVLTALVFGTPLAGLA